MKKICISILSMITLWQGYAMDGRVSVDVKNVGEPVILYGPAVGMMESAPRKLQGVREGEIYVFDIPDTDTLYYVRLQFQYLDEHFQSMSFFLAPGEKAAISGHMSDVLFDYDIEGPEAFEEWVRHRRNTYIQYEQELADIGYSPGDVDMQTPEIDLILDKVKQARQDYMTRNPDSDLSAMYLITGLATEENYALLSDRVKKGKYAPLLDYWMGLVRKSAKE